MYHKGQEINKLEKQFAGNEQGFNEAIIKLNDKILERAKVIGITKFDNESSHLPYWYSPDMNQCSHPVDNCNNVQTWTECHKYKNRVEWEEELWTNLSGLGSKGAPETEAQKKKDIEERNKQKSECDFTVPQSTWWINQLTERIMAKSKDINKYIADSVSWNWHPLDMGVLKITNLKDGINLNNPALWIEKDGRYFIPESLFNNPGYIKNYIKYSKMFSEEQAKKIAYSNTMNEFNRCGWSEYTNTNLYN